MSLVPAFELGLWNAWILMIWLILFPIFLNIGVKDKRISKRLETSVPIKYEKALNAISMTAMIVGVIYSIFLPLQFETILFYVGLLIFLFGFILFFAVLVTVRTVKIDEPFTKGPYRYSRHPIYLSQFLIFIGVVMICLSWVLLVLVFIIGIHQLISAPAEEQFCLKEYGDLYRNYMKRTPRWIGMPKSRKK